MLHVFLENKKTYGNAGNMFFLSSEITTGLCYQCLNIEIQTRDEDNKCVKIFLASSPRIGSTSCNQAHFIMSTTFSFILKSILKGSLFAIKYREGVLISSFLVFANFNCSVISLVNVIYAWNGGKQMGEMGGWASGKKKLKGDKG